MIAVECPKCGKPTPAFPLTPERVRCRACNYDGPPRPEVVEQLRASAHQIGAAQQRQAQRLGASQLWAHAPLFAQRARLRGVLVLLILPAIVFLGIVAVSIFGDDPYYAMTILFGLPLVAFAGSMFFAKRVIDRRIGELTEAFGAIPPAIAGGPAQCHLCGADLPPATSASPISRCRHCGTDNVASPDLIRDLVARHGAVVGDFDRQLARRAAFLAVEGATAVTWVIILAIASPVVGCVGGLGLELALEDVKLPRVNADYVFVSVGDDVCFALATEKTRDGTWEVVANLDDGFAIRAVPGAAGYTHVDERWFLGQNIKSGPGVASNQGVVKDVYRHVLRPERNQARIQSGPTVIVSPIEGHCLVVPPTNVRAFPWAQAIPIGMSAPLPSASAPGPGSTAPPSPSTQSNPKGKGR